MYAVEALTDSASTGGARGEGLKRNQRWEMED
jgi:hypothetical protein